VSQEKNNPGKRVNEKEKIKEYVPENGIFPLRDGRDYLARKREKKGRSPGLRVPE